MRLSPELVPLTLAAQVHLVPGVACNILTQVDPTARGDMWPIHRRTLRYSTSLPPPRGISLTPTCIDQCTYLTQTPSLPPSHTTEQSALNLRVRCTVLKAITETVLSDATPRPTPEQQLRGIVARHYRGFGPKGTSNVVCPKRFITCAGSYSVYINIITP